MGYVCTFLPGVAPRAHRRLRRRPVWAGWWRVHVGGARCLWFRAVGVRTALARANCGAAELRLAAVYGLNMMAVPVVRDVVIIAEVVSGLNGCRIVRGRDLGLGYRFGVCGPVLIVGGHW